MSNLFKCSFDKNKYLIIDLTQPLSTDLEVYPGDPKPSRELFTDIEISGYHHYIHNIGDHNFCPHIDAPNHQNIDLQDKGVEVFSKENVFTNSCLIDLSNVEEAEEFEGIKYLLKIEKKHLKKFKEIFFNVESVLIRTGYDLWIEKNNIHIKERIPFLDKGAVDFLASFKNLKIVGIDSLTVDPPKEHYAHRKFKNKWIIESLVHLYDIPKDSCESFILQVSPIKIIGATGAPVVVYAFV